MMKPLHPGEILEDILLSHAIKIFAEGIEESEDVVEGLLQGKVDITPELAEKIGAYLGNGAYLWKELQRKYDSFQLGD